MATRRSSSEALAQRCADAGWTVETAANGDGWTVRIPGDDDSYWIRRTYANTQALKKAITYLERIGLRDAEAYAAENAIGKTKRAPGTVGAEAKLAGKAVEQPLFITAEQQQAADKAAQQAAHHKKALSKASGNYITEYEECDLEWMLRPHPAPWMRAMYITPQAARTILGRTNTDNRKISDKHSMDLHLIMLSGQFHFTHQGIAFDTRGIYQDGQHRFEALEALANLPDGVSVPFDVDKGLPFAVWVGMPVENFKVIDNVRVRTAQQMLQKAGIANASYVNTCIRTVAAFDSGNPMGYFKGRKLTTTAAFAGHDADPENITKAVRYGGRQMYHRTGVSPGVFAAAYYLIGRANGFDNPYVEAFFEGYVLDRKYGTDRVLPSDDPRNLLRTRTENNHTRNRSKTQKAATPVEVVGWFIRCWNNLVEGNHVGHIRPYALNETPTILVCKPGQGAVPRALQGEV